MSAVLDAVSDKIIVRVPYSPRKWARKLHASFLSRIALVLHRRAGKTTAILNHHQRAATDDAWETERLRRLSPSFTDKEIAQLLKRRTYWHVMPTFNQGKKTGAWDTLQEISRVIPGVKINQSEMSVTYPNGNRVQIMGADNPDSLRGPALSGLSLDEYSQIASNLYGEILSKALADHLGYCIFSGTIKGKDELYKTYQKAKNNPAWFSLWQNVDESLATETGATMTALLAAMATEREEVAQGLITQAEFDQEWFLSAEAAIKGAFYSEKMQLARQQGRICRLPYDPMLPVDTDWDFGIDAMAIWFSQSTRSGEVRLIDYYEDVGGGLDLAIQAVKGQIPNSGSKAKVAEANSRRASYVYGTHWAPHDVNTRQYAASAKTTKRIAFEMGLKFTDTPKLEVQQGITAAQLFLQKCWFDEVHCDAGIDALLHYRRTWQQRLSAFSETPVHDIYSHGADAFRGLAVRYRAPYAKTTSTAKPRPPARVGSWMGG